MNYDEITQRNPKSIVKMVIDAFTRSVKHRKDALLMPLRDP